VNIKAKKDDARLISGDGIHHSGLEKRQKVLSVVFLVHHLLLFINFTFFFFFIREPIMTGLTVQ
jgi:hypothetical protein